MAVLGFDDDVWFGLQNAHHGFAQDNDNNNMNQMLFFSNNNNNNNDSYYNINSDNYLVLPSSSPHHPDMDAQLELQQQELEFILHFQNEKLRMALQEQRRQHLTSLMNSLETKATSLIQQKENDLARATRRGIDLQERLRRAETESRTWERIARAKESTVIELNNALLQALRNDNNEEKNDNNNGADDAESTCFASSEELKRQKWVCRVCKSRSSCVVLLPCKHLCSCKPCESFIGSCPVCESVKETSFEVLLV